MEEIGVQFVESWGRRMNDKTLFLARPHLDEAGVDAAREEGRRLTADEAVALALDSLRLREYGRAT